MTPMTETGFPPWSERAAKAHEASSAPAISYWCPAVAAEGLLAQPDSGRRLAALVLGPVDQGDGAFDDVEIEAVRAQLLGGAVLLDVGGEHLVERRIGRQRVLVELVFPQLGGRGPVDDRLGDQLVGCLLVQMFGEPED